MKIKKHLKKYWGLYLVILVVILGLAGFVYLWFLAGQPDNMFWRFQK